MIEHSWPHKCIESSKKNFHYFNGCDVFIFVTCNCITALCELQRCPRHYLLSPIALHLTTSRPDGLLLMDPQSYLDIVTKTTTTTVTKHQARELSNLKKAIFSERVVLIKQPSVVSVQLKEMSDETTSTVVRPVYVNSTTFCYKNCGRRRYKSAAYIEPNMAAVTYCIASYPLPCNCAICCDRVEGPLAWYRCAIEAVPVSYSSTSVHNFEFRHPLSSQVTTVPHSAVFQQQLGSVISTTQLPARAEKTIVTDNSVNGLTVGIYNGRESSVDEETESFRHPAKLGAPTTISSYQPQLRYAMNIKSPSKLANQHVTVNGKLTNGHVGVTDL